MKLFASCVVVCAAFGLAGCSSGLLGGGGGGERPGPATTPIAVNNQLAMPPDLALRAPGSYSPAVAAAPLEDDVYGGPVAKKAPGNPRPLPNDDVFAKYGIDKNKPDGTPKTQQQLSAELRAAVQADKRRSNPRYGTIFNMGELFRD